MKIDNPIIELIRQLITAVEKWIKDIVVAAIKESGGISGPVAPIDPVLDPCKEGPVIKYVKALDKRLIEFQFHGVEVKEGDISVINSSGITLQTEHMVFKSNTPTMSLNFDLVSGATYTLRFKATSCTGSNYFFFGVKLDQSIDQGCKETGVIESVRVEN